MSHVVATVLIAAGRFGGEVADTLKRRVRTRSEGRIADLAIVPFLPDAELNSDPVSSTELESLLAPLEDRLTEEINAQLALSTLVTYDPNVSSLPRLDLFFVGDLDSAPIRDILLPFIDRIYTLSRRRFANLLGRDADRAAVVPLLSVDEVPCNDAHELLERCATENRILVRPFLFERQTARYVLSPKQRISTVVALIEQLVLAGFREHPKMEGFLRDRSPRAGQGTAPAPFAATGLASIRIDHTKIRRYCRNEATIAMIKGLREGEPLGLEEREAMARGLRMDWEQMGEQLGLVSQSNAARTQFEQIIQDEAPTIDCPDIRIDDAPETITKRKYGEPWLDETTAAIDGFMTRFEQRRLKELADQIDTGAETLSRERQKTIQQTVDRWVWQSPTGWKAARSTLNLLKDETETEAKALQQRIASQTLPKRPTFERIKQGQADLHHEAARRPRSFRLVLTGITLFIIAVSMGYSMVALLKYPLAYIGAPAWLQTAVSPPYGAAIMALLALAVIPYSLSAMRKQRHLELEEVRKDLARTIEKQIFGPDDSLLAYYLSRLTLKQDLWMLRLVRQENRRFKQELVRLSEIQQALDTLWRRAQAEARRISSPTDDSKTGTPDLLLREIADPVLLTHIYRDAVPNADGLPKQFIQQFQSADDAIKTAPPWRETLPFASPVEIDRFLDDILDLPSPGELLAAPKERTQTIRDAFIKVLTELATRLSPALGLTESAVDSPKMWVISVPPAAGELVTEALSELKAAHNIAALGSDWTELVAPRDDGSIYLAVYVTHLTPSALAILRNAASPNDETKGQA